MSDRAVAALLLGVVMLGTASLAGRQQVTIVGDGTMVRDERAPAPGTGIILGRTIDPGTNQPVSGAVVNVRMGTARFDPVMSDEQGRFVFRDLPKGRYTLDAAKSGFVYGKYGKHLPDTGLDVNTDFQSLDLPENGRVGDAVIFLWKHAAIGGLVTDERGDPIVGIAVRAVRAAYTGGRRRFSFDGLGSVRTDDRGMYRFASLIPGEYIVAVPIVTSTWPKSLQRLLASPSTPGPPGFSDSTTYSRRWTADGGGRTALDVNDERFAFSVSEPVPALAGIATDGRLLAYETQFYAGATTLARASVIKVGSGEERSGVDLSMRPVATVRVSGTLTGPTGPAGNLMLRLVTADTTSLADDPEVNSTISDVDGSFTFLGVVPGDYVIKVLMTPRPARAASRGSPLPSATTARTAGGGGAVVISGDNLEQPLPTEPTLWAEMPIAVGDRDIRDVAVTLRAGARLMGKVEYEGVSDAPTPGRLTGGYIERADGSKSVNLNLLLARVDAQNNFSSFGQPAGRYFVRVPWSVAGWHFEGAMLGDRNLSITPIELGAEDVTGLVMKFSARPLAEISGVVRAGQVPAPAGTSVIVFPVDRATWTELGQNPPNFRNVAVVADGRYVVSGLPPGEYFVATTREGRIDWSESRNLDALSRQAIKIQIARGEKKIQDLVLSGRQPDAPDHDNPPHAYGHESHGPWVSEVDDAQTPTVRDTRPAAPIGTGIISGVVVTGDKDKPTPLRRAQVTLTGTALLGNRLTLTDDNGRFSFAGVPAGRFTLTASKPAFISSTYGASRPGRPGTPITLADGQRVTDISLNLARGAVLTGIISDARGQPVNGATVRALQYVTTNGVRRLQATGFVTTVQTDDRGAFRIHSLEAGEYGVGASLRQGGGAIRQTTAADVQFALEALKPAGARSTPTATTGARTTAAPDAAVRSQPQSYVPVFYPGTSDPSQAVLLTVAAGEERGGINFTLQPVPAATVSGIISNPSGERPANLEVRLLNVGATVSIDPFDDMMLGLPLRPQADGRFSFSGVAPGRYAVVATTGSGGRSAGAGGPLLWATTEVVVSGRDETNLQLSLQPGVAISGKVVFDATTLPPPALNAMRASVSPILTGSQVSVGQFQGSVGDDGTFSIRVMPGRYNVRATLPSGTTGWLLRSAMLGGRDVADDGFDVRAGDDPAAVTLTFTDRPGEINGALQDASGRPAPDYFIIVFPTNKTLWRAGARRIQQVRPGTDGRFTVRNLLAGEYQIAALTDVASGEAFDPAFLEKLVGHTVVVSLGEGEKKVQDIRIGG